MFEILPRHNLMLHYQPGPLQACDRYKRCSLVAAEPGQPPPPRVVLSEKKRDKGLIIRAAPCALSGPGQNLASFRETAEKSRKSRKKKTENKAEVGGGGALGCSGHAEPGLLLGSTLSPCCARDMSPVLGTPCPSWRCPMAGRGLCPRCPLRGEHESSRGGSTGP